MSTQKFATAPNGFRLTAVADNPDSRDFYYLPALKRLAPTMEPDFAHSKVLNQEKEGACTGFGLAAVINQLNARRDSDTRVSARMLYNIAQKFDRWPGEDYSGSSCRGAIRGWKNMGVCSDKLWPYKSGDTSQLTVARAKDARNTSIGAYYRLKGQIVDFHAALNEVGAIYMSANVHPGWWPQNIRKGVIPPSSENAGGHAFAVVGYNDKGFWVQNSWGQDWGRNGFALWLYEDWQANVKDAWVLTLALPTPQIFPGNAAANANLTGEGFSFFEQKPERAEIAGHFVHIDDGELHDNGRYWSNIEDVRQTAKLVAKSDDYDHLLFYAHGGLNSTSDSAKRVRAMKEVFKDNRVYPYHFMYDTGVMEELKDVILNRYNSGGDKVAGFTDYTDKLVESSTRVAGRALWREMKRGAERPFDQDAGGKQTLDTFLKAMDKSGKPKKIHLVGHSTGGILLAYLVDTLAHEFPGTRIETCTLLAPATTLDLFDNHYLPHLGKTVRKMQVFNLSEKLELDDNVALVYRKSLLYLVSRAFEERHEAPLLGMRIYSKKITPPAGKDLDFVYSRKRRSKESRSTSHGGFDNDPYTLNSMLKTVLDDSPKRKFTESDLDY